MTPEPKTCPKCGQPMAIRKEEVRVGDSNLTTYEFWECAVCGHEEMTGKTYVERFGET